MPTYSYKCNECGNKYDVFHKVREISEDVICPQCSSTDYSKLISAVNFGGSTASYNSDFSQLPPCPSGNCSTGSCGLN